MQTTTLHRCAALALAASVSSTASAATFPGPAPCNGTLQSCIDGLASGDVLEIATNTPVMESLTISKPFTLRAAHSYQPTIQGTIMAYNGAVDGEIAIEGLAINGYLRMTPGTGNLTARIQANTITLNSGYQYAIDLSSGTFPPYGNVSAVVSGNHVFSTGSGAGNQCGGLIFYISDSGASVISVTHNTIVVNGCGQGEAIYILNGPGENLRANVVGNHVEASNTNLGIMLRNFHATANSLLTGYVVNNTVTGQRSEAGMPGAIAISSDGQQAVYAEVVNNTVMDNDIGIFYSGRTDLGATLNGVVANNIVVNNGFGIMLDAGIANRNNLVYGNGLNEEGNDTFTHGPGTLTVSPGFRFPWSFLLRADSPARNAGDNASLPSFVSGDAGLRPRIAFGTIDLGAWEIQWPDPDQRDLNKDGKADLLWRHATTGELLYWQLAGTAAQTSKSFGVVPNDWQILESRSDLNFDQTSDLLWRNTATGELSLWQMNGTLTPGFRGFGTLASDWQLLDARSDFDGDDDADLLWRNTATGNLTFWLMNGTGAPTFKGFGGMSSSWQLLATGGDYNQDGIADLVLRNSVSGALSLWLMSGSAPPAFKGLGTLGTDWQLVQGLADYNGDGKSDLLWRNTSTGALSLWQMNGTGAPAFKGFGTLPTAWQIAQSKSDFNGDGKADLLWRNTVSGELSLWLMNGTGNPVFKGFGILPTTWELTASNGDYNGDGMADLLWRNTATGDVSAWLMNGSAAPTYRGFGVLAASWVIEDADSDYNADAKSDILWRNGGTNEAYLWLMNGASPYTGKSLGTLPTSWSLLNDD